MKAISNIWVGVFLGVLASTPALGDAVVYNININTALLVGHPAEPFALEFQFNDGSGTGDGNNTAILNNFNFGGGAANGISTVFGGVTGNLNSSVTMVDSSFFNQFIEGFNPGASLNFRLMLTTNLDDGGVPDELSLSILDSSGVEIPTLGPANAFAIIDIDSSSPSTYSFPSDTSRNPNAGGPPIDIGAPILAASSSQVPEPASLLLTAIAFVALVGRVRLFRVQTTVVHSTTGFVA